MCPIGEPMFFYVLNVDYFAIAVLEAPAHHSQQKIT